MNEALGFVTWHWKGGISLPVLLIFVALAVGVALILRGLSKGN
jgi:hypothetical protein